MKKATFLLFAAGFFALYSCQKKELSDVQTAGKQGLASISTAPGLDPETHVPATRTRGTSTRNAGTYGATGNDTTDDTDAIQAAIDALPTTGSNIGGTVNIPAGTYYIRADLKTAGGVDITTNCIRLKSNMLLSLAPNTILRQIPTDAYSAALILAYDVENVEIAGGEIIGDIGSHLSTTGEANMGVKINYSQHVTVRDMKASKFWGDGFYVGGMDDTFGKCFDVDIDNVISDSNRRQGLSITEADSVEVWDSEFINTGLISGTSPQAGIDIEPGNDLTKYHDANNIIIRNCTIKDNTSVGILVLKRTPNVTIMHCDVSGNTGGIVLDEDGPVDPFIGWNELHNNSGNGLFVKDGVDGVTVTQNLFYENLNNGAGSVVDRIGYYMPPPNGTTIWAEAAANWELGAAINPVVQTNHYK